MSNKKSEIDVGYYVVPICILRDSISDTTILWRARLRRAASVTRAWLDGVSPSRLTPDCYRQKFSDFDWIVANL